ncbi:MAG: MFS transporter [Deltaproteobacteria bacterium]|nr:MFS transporter [Deltaproteobacteria bacterium]
MRVFGNLVDVRPGEGGLVLRSTITLFGLIAAHTLLETARDTLFLTRLPPERLTWVYAALAAFALLMGRLNTRFVRNFGRRNALVFTLFTAAYGSVVLYLVPQTPLTFYALYVFSGLLGSVMVVQFWMFTGRMFTVAQSKRLFGLVAAGGVLGAVAGAGAAVPVVSRLPVELLLLAAAGLFLATAMVLTTVRVDDAGVPVGGAGGSGLAQGLALFRDNPYLTRLALLVAVSTGAVLATDYLFKSVAAARLAPAELGSFFAQFYAGLNAVALAVQLLVAQALVRRTGVIVAFSLLPFLLLLGTAGTALTGGAMLAVLATKGADGALRHSLHRICSELLWLPVPDEVRTQSKVFIDTVVVRGTQALTAALLLGATTMAAGRPGVLAVVIAVLAMAWLMLAMGLRKPYLELFRSALQANRAIPTDDGVRLDLDSVEVVIEAMSSRDPARAIAAIDLLVSSGRSRLIPALVLYHESPEVLQKALEAIATPERSDWLPLAARLLEHDEQPVRFAALRALARVGHRTSIEGRLLDISPAVRAHAAYWLAESHPEPPEQQPEVQAMLQMTGDAGAHAQVGLLEAIAAEGRQRWAEVVMQAATNPDPRVSAAATRAMAQVRDERFIPFLIGQLRFREGRATVREAIVQLGAPALEALERALRHPDTDPRVRRHVPRTLSRFGTQAAADVLAEQLAFETDGAVRYKVLRGLGRMVMEHPVQVDRAALEAQTRLNLVEHFRLAGLRVALVAAPPASAAALRVHALLVGLLGDKVEQALERAFRLLQIVHRQEDLRLAFQASTAQDRQTRAQAMEFLDALTLDASDPALRELLRLAVDDLPWPDRVARAQTWAGAPAAGSAEVMKALTRDGDAAMRTIAQHYARLASQPTLHPVSGEVSHAG